MRKLLIAAVTIGIIASIAVCASYGWDQATALKDRVTQAFFFGFLAFAAIILHAMAIRIWVWGWHRCAVFVGVIAFLGFAATAFISLGGVASRSDAFVSERQDALDAKADIRKQIATLDKELEKITAPRTTKAVVDAAKKKAAAAKLAKERECGDGSAKQRGPYCRQREEAEVTATGEVTTAELNKAATDGADVINGKLAVLRGKLTGSTTGVGSVDPLRALLTAMVGGWADLVTSWWKAVLVVIYDLCLIGMMVAIEVLGHASPAARPAGLSTTPARPEPQPRLLDRLLDRNRKSKIAEPAPALVIPPAPKPKLVASNPTTPVGSTKRILTDNLEASPGQRVELAELADRYKLICNAEAKRVATQDVFTKEVGAFCNVIGIKRRTVGGKLYLLDVQLTPIDHRKFIDQSTSDVER